MSQPLLICADCIHGQTGQSFSLWQGLSRANQQQLLAFTKDDSLIIQNTRDSERFGSGAALADWLGGKRTVYALTLQEDPNVLAGLFWFAMEDLPFAINDPVAQNSHWTMGIRIYETYRGQHLSVPLLTKCFEHFWQTYPTASVWLSTQQNNQVGQKIYEQFGARQIATKRDKLFYIIEPRKN